jgi:hypothetical protein
MRFAALCPVGRIAGRHTCLLPLQEITMAHVVIRKGYASIEESYRDERGRPRKKVLRWIGRVSETVAMNLRSEPGAGAWGDWERQQLDLYETEQEGYQAALDRLPDGLHVGPTDPVEPVSSELPSIEQDASSTQAPSAHEQDAGESSSPSDPSPDAEPSGGDPSLE